MPAREGSDRHTQRSAGTFDSWLKQAGNDSMVVAKLLGHSTTRMVELVYGHLSTNEYKTAIADLPSLRGTPVPTLPATPAPTAAN